VAPIGGVERPDDALARGGPPLEHHAAGREPRRPAVGGVGHALDDRFRERRGVELPGPPDVDRDLCVRVLGADEAPHLDDVAEVAAVLHPVEDGAEARVRHADALRRLRERGHDRHEIGRIRPVEAVELDDHARGCSGS
jgi:hypothetical protein